MRLFVITILSLSLFACKKAEDPTGKLQPIDFSKPAAIGGNFLSGVQDGALKDRGQIRSIPALFFSKTEEYGGGKFNIKLINSSLGIGIHSKPWEGAMYQEALVLGTRIDCKEEESLGPVKTLNYTSEPDEFMNKGILPGQFLCIPYMEFTDLDNPNFGAESLPYLYYFRLASQPGFSTVLEDFNSYQPTFSIIHLGMEDIFNYAIEGGFNKTLPPPSSFENYLDQVLSVASNNNGKGVLVNIPPLEYFPFFNLIPLKGGDMTQEQADQLNELATNGGFPQLQFNPGENYFVTTDYDYPPENIRQLKEGEMVLMTVPLDSIKCYLYGTIGAAIHERYVLDSTEISNINQHIYMYNNIIASKADQYNFALFNLNQFMSGVNTGIKWDGADFDLSFVTGGFLSLDGLHPNEKGYALITNKIIRAVNNHYGSNIPIVNCLDCNGVLFP